VRSAIPNFFLTRLASDYVTVVLSGEGADELFSGYHYLKDFDENVLHDELVEITSALHNCNLQRLDRMAMAHSLEGRVPFLDVDFVELSFAVPLDQKIHRAQNIEKWALRKACEDLLPDDVVWRTKEKFSKGAGSAHVFEQIAEAEIDDQTFTDEVQQVFKTTGYRLRSKEELYYYRIFRESFQPGITALVGEWPGQ
jgi:asparagine synthase (glutamine-hydrolysing)